MQRAGRSRQWLDAVPAARVWTVRQRLPLMGEAYSCWPSLSRAIWLFW